MISTHNKKKKFQKLETNDIDNTEEKQEVREINGVNGPQKKIRNWKKLAIATIFFILLCVASLLGYFFGAVQTKSGNNNQNTNHHLRNEEECVDKKCCKAIDLSDHSANFGCNKLSVIDCIFDASYCEWDCDYFERKNQNASYIPLRSRKRVFGGLSAGIGVYFEDEAADEGLNEDDEPYSVNDLRERSKMITVDDCGVMYEEILEYDIAVEEFEKFEKYQHLVNFSAGRRRMSFHVPDGGDGGGNPNEPNGLINSNDQDPIGQQNGLNYPDSSIGCFTFVSSNYDGYDPNAQYNYQWFDHICTGVLISPIHVLTAGHCCHSGLYGTSFYSDWYYYPEIQWYGDISYASGISVSHASVYQRWRDYRNYHYNFCILTLSSPHWGSTIRMGYDIASHVTPPLSTIPSFNTLGYRFDRYSSNYNGGYLLYGWKDKYLRTVTPYQFTFAWDAYYHGFGGAPIYYAPNSVVYCVISQFGYQYNTCVRITYLIYYDFCYLIRGYPGIHSHYCFIYY